MANRNTRIRIMIETLTGTLFEIFVNKQDTVLSIKWKIYRVEGIPVTQQHLLYRLKELDDWTTLQDSQIADGASLKLVVSMRGGPIATRRTLKSPAYDDAWLDFKEFLESSDEPGARGRYRVEVHQDGNSVSIFRIAIPDDSLDSPVDVELPDTLHEPAWALDKIRENVNTLGKVRELRNKMETLQLKRSKNNSEKTCSDSGEHFNNVPGISKTKKQKEVTKSRADIISEELELLGLINKTKIHNTLGAMKRNIKTGTDKVDHKFLLGMESPKYSIDIKKNRRQREDSESSDESRITQVSRRHKTELLESTEEIPHMAMRFKSDSELSLELGLSDTEEPYKMMHTNLCNVPSTAGDSARYHLSCLLLPSGDSPRPQTTPEELSARDDSLETFSLQLESPKLHLDAPVSAKVNLSDSVECLELPNPKPYPNIKTSTFDTVISQYLQNNSKSTHDLSTALPGSSRTRYDGPSLQRSTRTFFRSNPALHRESQPHQCSSTSNLDRSKNIYFNDLHDFEHSCSTSNLEKLNTKKFETPNLTRHSNTEYLDYTGSYENLDSVRITKRENLNYSHGRNRTLNRSSESLYKIHENNLSYTTNVTKTRFSRRNSVNVQNPDYIRNVEGPLQTIEGLTSMSCEGRHYNRDEHKILKIPNSGIFREESIPRSPSIQQTRNKNKNSSPCLPHIKNTARPKTESYLPPVTIMPMKKNHNGSLIVLEAPTKKQKSSADSPVSASEEKSETQQNPPADDEVKPPPKKTAKIRCKVCAKKLTITTVMVCRCGGTFCALHRYAETHDCSYDYKEEGRRQIEQDNPVVTAPKLPKI